MLTIFEQTVFCARCQPANQRQPNTCFVIYCSQKLPRPSFPKWDIPKGSRYEGQTTSESDDRPSRNGSNDEYGEGQYDDDGSADGHHGMDQCVLQWIYHQYVIAMA